MKSTGILFPAALIMIHCMSFGQVHKKSQYEPSWESLKTVPIPKWFEDAKLGIFIHWGPYSVLAEIPSDAPGNYSEHLPSNMYRQEGYNEILLRRFGAVPPDFGYKDMIPQFKGEKFDADEWLNLFVKAGARYIVPVAEHHDGFAMWESDLTPWNAKDMGPKRDIIGELEKATRKRGLKFAPSIHRERHNTYYQIVKNKGGGPLPAIVEEIRRVPEAASLYGPFEMTDEYMENFLARWEEICDKYQPDFYWLDDYPKYDTIDRPLFMKYQRKLIADYINRANNEWGKEVYFNNKGGKNNYPDGVGIREADNMHNEDLSMKWQNPATLGVSYGYRKIEEFQEGWMKPPRELIHLLIEVVSKNGNLLLNVGPRPDGTIPEVQQAGLMAIGEWLKTNGSAIYDTRVWKTAGEGRVRFTVNGSKMYVILLDWPQEKTITLKSTSEWKQGDVTAVRLLGGSELSWRMEEEGLSIKLPPKVTGNYAYALEISTSKDLQDLPAVTCKLETANLHKKHKERITAIKNASKEGDSSDYDEN